MNADAYGDALDGALREVDRLSRVNAELLEALKVIVVDDAIEYAAGGMYTIAVTGRDIIQARRALAVAQPLNTDDASGSPSSYRARPSDPDLNPDLSASASPATKEQQLTDEELADCGLLSELFPDEPKEQQ